MSNFQEEDIVLELLNNIFEKCDINGRGVVEIDALITILSSQDPSWQGDNRKIIEDEFRKLLHSSDTSQVITQSYFTSSLLNWFKTKYEKDIGQTAEGLFSEDSDGKCESQSSGIGEDITPASSLNSIEENLATVHFVSDGHNFIEEEVNEDDVAEEDKRLQHHYYNLVKKLESEICSLQKKNEFLESANCSLIAQMSSVEEALAKKEKESSNHVNKLESNNQLLDKFEQNQEEAEEKLNTLIEENKSVTIQLSQSVRENAKLKTLVDMLETQIDTVSSEKSHKDTKIKEYKDRFALMSNVHNQCLKELETLKIKEATENESLEKILEQNKMLQSQLDSNVALVQDLQTELASTQKELSALRVAQIDNQIQCTPAGDSSLDNSMNFLDALNNTIPLETSLLAELQKKVHCGCECVCLRNLSFSSSSSGPSYVNTSDEKSFADNGTMTEYCDLQVNKDTPEVTCRDVGVDCSIKPQELPQLLPVDVHSCESCQLKSKRSLTKWIVLGLILMLLFFLLGFTSASALLVRSFVRSSRHSYCLSSLFDLLILTATPIWGHFGRCSSSS